MRTSAEGSRCQQSKDRKVEVFHGRLHDAERPMQARTGEKCTLQAKLNDGWSM